jgi:LydA holin phage, holin superfamily III
VPQSYDQMMTQVLWLVLAAFGGIARYTDDSLKHDSNVKLLKLLCHAAVAMFSGYMIASVALILYPQWTSVAAGVGGFCGTRALDWLFSLAQNRFGGAQSLELETKIPVVEIPTPVASEPK